MSSTAPTVSPLLVQRVVEGLKAPVLVVTDLEPDRATSPPYGAVVVTASDLASLRGMLRLLPDLGRSRMVAVVVGEDLHPMPLRIDPRWPALQDLDARLEDGAAVTIARFTARLDVAEVLTGIAYADGPPGHGGLIVARGYDPADKVPPDVVTEQPDPGESPVLGRAPAYVPDPGPEPLDETLFHPGGFRRDWQRGVVDLDPAWRATPGLVASLRDAQGIRVPSGSDDRLVAALAMSGIPLVAPGDEAELDDADARERLSARLSREASEQHSISSWRRRLAEQAGVRVATQDERERT